MRKNLTEMVFILDKSGSMSGLEKDTIGGFNSMIERQKKEPGEAFVSTVLFANESTVIHDRVDLRKIDMNEYDYEDGEKEDIGGALIAVFFIDNPAERGVGTVFAVTEISVTPADDFPFVQNDELKARLIRRVPFRNAVFHKGRRFLKCFVGEKVHHRDVRISRVFVYFGFIPGLNRPEDQSFCLQFHSCSFIGHNVTPAQGALCTAR